jgi:hypothetical protein
MGVDGRPSMSGDHLMNRDGPPSIYPPPPQDPSDRPPQGPYDRLPQGPYDRPPQGPYDRPPQGPFDRPPQGPFDRPPQGLFDRPPPGFLERPPIVDAPSLAERFNDRPPPFRIDERNPSEKYPDIENNPPISYGDKAPEGVDRKIYDEFNDRNSREEKPVLNMDAKPVVDTNNSSPMDIVDDQEEFNAEFQRGKQQVPMSRGFQAPPPGLPFHIPSDFGVRFPNRSAPVMMPGVGNLPPRFEPPNFPHPSIHLIDHLWLMRKIFHI